MEFNGACQPKAAEFVYSAKSRELQEHCAPEGREQEFPCSIYGYPGMDKIYCISDCMFLPALLAQDHENCNAPALIAPSKGECAMRVLYSASSIGVCVLAVACCADRIENVAANL
jgi:hypothetical protein